MACTALKTATAPTRMAVAPPTANRIQEPRSSSFSCMIWIERIHDARQKAPQARRL